MAKKKKKGLSAFEKAFATARKKQEVLTAYLL